MRKWEMSSLGNFIPPPLHVLYIPFAIYSLILGSFRGAGCHLALKFSLGGHSPWSLFAFICLGWQIYPQSGFLDPRPFHNSPLKPYSLETFWDWGFSRRWERCRIQNAFPRGDVVSPSCEHSWCFEIHDTTVTTSGSCLFTHVLRCDDDPTTQIPWD